MTSIIQGCFSKGQLREIKLGLIMGIDVRCYAYPSILPKAMRGIRKYLTWEKKRKMKMNTGI